MRASPLCATTSSMPVGSPTMHPAGRTPRATMSAISRRTPMQPTSSSYERAKCRGLLRPRRTNSARMPSPTAEKLFMSVTPRPYSRSSRRVATNGSVSHGWPSTGTTSVWPERTMPPSVALPSRERSVAKRFALRRSSSNVSVDENAVAREIVAHPMDQRRGWSRGSWYRSHERADEVERREVFGARGAGRTSASVAGAFMDDLPGPKEEG